MDFIIYVLAFILVASSVVTLLICLWVISDELIKIRKLFQVIVKEVKKENE